ncbi:DNA translocase FtsK 4TM domain-containing protein [Pararhodobacter marinus]|uniref:DNA translocase FtsK 4TM domain-containing protein n=2 Tax=Pararhodobacter marinus TaxID=2184063 RepID=UPI003517FE06
MASFPTPNRDPLIDSRLQAILSQRGKELLGLCLIGLGLILALILGSYSPEDPTWMAATDAPVHNALGRVGAAIAAPMTKIIGLGSWGIALALCIWGLRLVIHQGEEYVLQRSFFAPVAIAVGAVWLSSLVPGAGWTVDHGQGGMFGDTVLAAVMTALPMTAFVANLVTLASFAATVALYLYILGSTLPELKRIGQFLLSGLILSYAGLCSLLGLSARGMGGLALKGHESWQHRRETRAQARAAAEQALAQHQRWSEPQGRYAPAYPAAPDDDYPLEYLPDDYGPDHGPDYGTDPRYDPQPQPGYRPLQATRGQAPGPAARNHVEPPISNRPAPRPDTRPDKRPVAQDRSRSEPRGHDPYESRRDASHDSGRAEGYGQRYTPQHRAPAAARAPEPMAEPVPGPAPQAWGQPPRGDERGGLLSRVSALGRRSDPAPEAEPSRSDWSMPDGELIEPQSPAALAEATPPSPEGLRARIAELMGSRKRSKPVLRFDPDAYPARAAAEAVRPAAEMSGPRREPALTAGQPAVAPMAPAMVPATAAAPQPVPTPPQSYSFSHAFGYQPAPASYPGATAPAPGRFTERPEEPALLDEEDDPFDPHLADDDYDAYAAPVAPRAPAAPVAAPVASRVQQAPARPPVPSRRAQAEAQPSLAFEPAGEGFELPPLALLRDPALEKRQIISHDALDQNARMLESVLEDYGVRGEIISCKPGPVVTMYELEPAPGLKASRVIGLADDIARSMSALSARVSTVPGRSVIGIELPNADRHTVVLREILATRDFGDSTMRLPLALGKDIGGEAVVANLAKMPHLLIAGTTGSGKSVAINTMILSLLYKLTPAECRLIMIDPKMLELSVYDGIPHLLSPVVTDPKKAVVALKWVVGEMEERYRKMSKMGVRNIDGYNGRVREALDKGEMFKRTVQTGFDDETGDPVFETEEFAPEALPFIVVIVDEMADLMMVAGKEIEACIQRLAQMARASGIHLIMATQRPSVDVITGTIKANFPTRISFQVTSKIDSRTILGEQGAEQLLGMGDMLYMAGGAKITRVHGPFVSDSEVEEVVQHLKSFGPPDYVGGVVEGPEGDREADIDAVLGLGGDSGGEDALYDQAVAIVAKDRKCSTSYIQRKLGIGYNKAARLVEQMEDQGVVSQANHVGKREILIPEMQ